VLVQVRAFVLWKGAKSVDKVYLSLFPFASRRDSQSVRVKLFFFFILGCLCFLLVLEGQGQMPGTYSGRILDTTGAPLALATVYAQAGRQGVVADLEGKWLLRGLAQSDTLIFRYTGFEVLKLPIAGLTNPVIVKLKPAASLQREVEILGAENPANRLIRNAQRYRERNDPFALPGFSYKAYTKMRMQGIAGAAYDELFQKLLARADLFLWENVVQRTWEQPDKSTEQVIGTKMSGLPDMALPISPTQLLDFNFYAKRIQFLASGYPGPIADGSFDHYRYELLDVLPEERDTVFVIAFTPRNEKSLDFSGVLRLHSGRWTLLAVEATLPEAGTTGRIRNIQLAQYSKPVNDTLWFPYQFNTSAELAINPADVSKNRFLTSIKTQLQEIDVNWDTLPRVWNGVNLRLEPRAALQNDKFWQKYRGDTLSLRENATYQVLDSVSTARGFGKKLKILRALGQGMLDLKYFKLDLGRLYEFNFVEKHRVGLGIQSPDIMSKKVQLNAWLAYGIGDKRVKWGGSVMLFPFRSPLIRFRYTYASDLNEAGTDRLGLDIDDLFFQRRESRLTFREVWTRYMDYTDRHKLEFFATLPRTLYHRFAALREETRPAYQDKYSYNGRNYFQFFELQYGFRWAPGEQLTQEGNYLFNNSLKPILEGRATFGIAGVLGSRYAYQKYELAFSHTVRIRKVGRFEYLLTGGWLEGDMPYSKLYVYRGNGNAYTGSPTRTVWGDSYAYNTMEFARFTADRYANLFLSFTFYNRRFPTKKWSPSLRVLSSIGWGLLRQNLSKHRFDNSDKPHFFPMQAPERGYYESGLRLSKLFPDALTRFIPPINSLAIGFYYRYGPYTSPRSIDNFAVKLEWDFNF
jgi:hypothetical protein